MFLAGHTVIVLLDVLAILYVITVFSICLMIVFENRNPVKTLSWLLVILFVPIAGLVIYMIFRPLLPQAENLHPQKHD